jgi:site-specific DNA recombinase
MRGASHPPGSGPARPPFGYRVGSPHEGSWRLDVDPEQAAIVTEVAKRVIAGDSMTSIATELSERGVPTPHDWHRQRQGRQARGGRWTTDALRGILGPHLGGRPVVDGQGFALLPAPAILTPQTYADLELELNRRRAAPLHGIVRCACGSGLELSPQPGKPPPQWDYECHLSIPAWWLGAMWRQSCSPTSVPRCSSTA